MNMLVNTPQIDDWTWIDAIQMGMPWVVFHLSVSEASSLLKPVDLR
ncbi:hypothetical protein [Duncaniella freteri]